MTTKEEYKEKLRELECMSDDPDTQVVCIVSLSEGGYYFAGANMLPERVEAKPERLERPAKYQFISHAEDSAIAYAAKYGIRTQGATAYINWFPCSRCAAILVNSGIQKLVADREGYESRKEDPRYSFKESMEILTEAGIEIDWF